MMIAARLTPDRSRLLVFHLNVSALLSSIVKTIQSGKTGYAWVIDQDGPFIYHPNPDFFGRDAFAVRDEKFPDIVQRAHPLHPEGEDAQGRAGNRLVLLGLAPRLHRADQEADRLLPDSDRRQPSPLLVGGRGGAAVRGGGRPAPGLFPAAAAAGAGGPRGDPRCRPPSSGWKTAGRASWKPRSSRKPMPWPNPRKNTARSWKAPRTSSSPWTARAASSR